MSMHTRVFLFLLLAVLAAGLVAALPTGAAEKIDSDRIGKLIEQLGSGDFAERERAYQALDSVGAAALDALRGALKSDDAEIRRRAEDLVAKWEKVAEREKILKPTMLRLTFNDTPLSEALETVRQKTGLQIYLHDPENKLASRKVTVDTGEKTLWQAFDLFCEKAGLTDGDPSQVAPTRTPPGVRPVIRVAPAVAAPAPAVAPAPAAPPAPPAKEEKKEPAPAEKKPGAAPAPPKAAREGAAANFLAPLLFAAMTMQVLQLEVPPGAAGFIGPAGKPGFNPYAANQVLLVDGKPSTQPVDYAGAVRIRALPNVANIPLPRTEKDIVLGLHVMPEPRLALQTVVGVTVEKAVDDQGQRLSQSMDDVGDGGNTIVGPGGVMVLRGRVLNRYPGAVGNQVGLKLQKGEKPSKSLKELKGTITAQIRTTPTELMAVEKLLDAKGQKAKADGGGNLEILNVAKNEDGSYAVDVKVEVPTGVQAVNPGTIGGTGAATTSTVIAGPGGVRRSLYTGGYVGLLVTDAKGNRLPMALTKSTGNRAAGGPVEYGFQVVPQAGHGEPAKISFTGAAVLGVDIPFSLKDVQIP
jgi:hypothetical protein